MLGLFLMIRLIPAVSIFWAKRISLPLLGGLSAIGDSFPFALLEWMTGAVCILLAVSLLRKRLIRAICSIGLALVLGALAVWYPLYFLPQPVYTAGTQEISTLCTSLIDELNAGETGFRTPDDLPAKFIRFPAWMDMLRISGLCSFLTGEALITPELEPVSQPFVAVHERMHLRGFAGEGAANIAAWEECLFRGGAYAFSARIWALRYGMGVLRNSAPALYEENMLRMNHETLQFYRQAGGAYTPAPLPEFLRRLYAALGIEAPMQDYEILASCLAAGLAE